VLIEMMETMRKQNEERAKEFRRAQEEFRRESAQSREMLDQIVERSVSILNEE